MLSAGMIELGPSDNVALDQPRVAIELIKDTGATAFRYDFGTDGSPVETGFLRGTTADFDGTVGWQPGAASAGIERATGSDLNRDFVSLTTGTFSRVLANGTYQVEVHLGDLASPRDQMAIWFESETSSARPWVNTAAGQVVIKSYQVEITDGRLDVHFQDMGGTDSQVTVVGLEVVRLDAGWASVGPDIFNTLLLDTGANSVLAMATAVNDLEQPPVAYDTQGLFDEVGVGGSHLMDVSVPYRFDFAGSNGVRNTLFDVRIQSDANNDFSMLGPWGLAGMPAMANRVTSFDMTGWSGGGTGLDDLYMKVAFNEELPAGGGHRYALSVDNRLSFDPLDYLVSGEPPVWADIPFLTAIPTQAGVGQEGNFLFDTGAQISVISERLAVAIGLDSNGDGVLDQNDDAYLTSETIGGVGGQRSVPVFAIDEVRVPVTQVSTGLEVELVWTDLMWLVLDIEVGEGQPPLDGVFGSDLLTSGWFYAFFYPGMPDGYIDQVHLDFRQWGLYSGTPEPRSGTIYFDLNAAVDQITLPEPGIRIRETARSTEAAESGATDTYTVVLTDAPSANVTINLAVQPVGHLTAVNDADQTTTLVFTPSNWNVPQTVRVAAVNDDMAEGTHAGAIVHAVSSLDPDYNNLSVPNVTVKLIDDDLSLIRITSDQAGQNSITSLDVSEGGSEVTYWVALTSAPSDPGSYVFVEFKDLASNAQIELANTDGGPFDLTDALTFTISDWSQPKAIKVTAIDDTAAEGPHQTSVAHTVGELNLSGWLELGQTSLAVRIADNEVGSVTITQTGGSTDLSEGGAADTYQIALGTAPAGTVQITVTADAQTELSADGGATFSPTLVLSFTDTSSQTIAVRAVDDEVDEAAHTGRITHAVTGTVNDPRFPTTLSIASVTAAIMDDDTAGVAITETGGSTAVVEGGPYDTYNVVLNSRPTGDVTIYLSNADGQVTAVDDANTANAFLRFTPSNWSTPQAVRVNAVDDAAAEPTRTTRIAHGLFSADSNYQGSALVTVTVEDNDAVNTAPSVALENRTTTLAENVSTATRRKVADILVSDDALGTRVLSLSGEDAALFVIDGSALYLRESIALDHATNPVLTVIVAVNDPDVGETPDDTADLAITITDAEPPTVMIVREMPLTEFTNADAVTFAVTFSEVVQNVDATDFVLVASGGVLANATVELGDAGDADASTYHVTVTGITGDGTLGLGLAAGTDIQDGTGHTLNSTPIVSQTYGIDNTRPTAAVARYALSELIGQNMATFLVTFSELVLNVDAADFILATTGSVSADATLIVEDASDSDPLTFTVTVDGLRGDGILALNFAAGTDIRDPAGNGLAPVLTKQETYSVDHTSPRAAITRRTPLGVLTNAEIVIFDVIFNDDVLNVDAADFVLDVDGTVSVTAAIAVSDAGDGDASTFVVEVGPITGEGTLYLQFAEISDIQDVACNPLDPAPTADEYYTFDRSPPTVAITRLDPAGPLTSAAAVTFAVRFSEDVQNVDASDFAPATSGSVSVGGLTLSDAGDSDASTYTVTVSSISGNGILGLDLAAATDIQDTAGNALDTPPTADEIYTIDTTPPVATIRRQTPLEEMTTADTVTFSVTFSEDVENVDASDFAPATSGEVLTGGLSVGDAGDADASTYTVTMTSITGSGTLGLALAAGTDIHDAAGNAVSLAPVEQERYTIGEISFLLLESQDLSGGTLSYTFTTRNAAILTLHAEDPDVQLVLFDESMNELARSVERLDYSAQAGQTFSVQMSSLSGTADSIDLRIANLVELAGEEVTVHGTPQRDLFSFDASGVLQQGTVSLQSGPATRLTVNGIAYAFDGTRLFTFDGSGGEDHLDLVGSSDVDVVRLLPHRALLSGNGYSVVATNIASSSFEGGANDVARIYGTRRSNTLAGIADTQSLPGRLTLGGDGVSIAALAGKIYTRGNGGKDAITLSPSPGDTVQPFWNWTRVWGTEDYREARGFRDIYLEPAAASANQAALVDMAMGQVDKAAASRLSAEELAQLFWLDQLEAQRESEKKATERTEEIDLVLAGWQ